MKRRTLIATTAGAVASVAAAGCLTDDAPGASTTERTTTLDDDTTIRSPPETTEPSTPTTTEESFSWSEASNEPDPSKYVRLGNEGEDGVAHTVSLEVYHEATGEVVHDRTHTVAAGETKTVYDTADANPTGVDSFRVTAAFEGESKEVGIETSECYGSAQFVVSSENELRASYTIC
jgi:hypothetical protein